MKYTIYQITNLIDDKIYIGKHQTNNINDNYMGSGKFLKYAQSKYGLENFVKEILFVFDSEEEMNAKEAELVTEEFCLREDTYNICIGGHGGFSYINANKTSADRSKAGLAGGFANPTEYVNKRRYEGSVKGAVKGYNNGLKKWLEINTPITGPGLAVMQSDAANEKRKNTTKGRVSVYDLELKTIVRFEASNRKIYDENRARYVGIRRAKKLGLI